MYEHDKIKAMKAQKNLSEIQKIPARKLRFCGRGKSFRYKRVIKMPLTRNKMNYT